MSRLYFRIYLYFLVFAVAFGIAAAVGWLAHVHDARRIERFDAMGRLLAHALPKDGPALPGTLEGLARDFGVGIALYDPDLALIATAGSPQPPPLLPAQRRKGWHRSDVGRLLVFSLPDGRWLSAHHSWRSSSYVIEMLVALVAFAAVAAYPLARAITRRLERLKTRVDALGAGDLSARVEVEGWDEVAALANSFNRAAARIESLVSGQRTMLASVSHELRTPLARMRVAIELLATDPRPELRERIERDVVELDNLIDELLLASRLQVAEDLDAAVPVDLLALAAEEGARGRRHGHRRRDDHLGKPPAASASPAQPVRERRAPRRRIADRRMGGSGRGRRRAPDLRPRPGYPRDRARTHLRAVLPRCPGARDGTGGRPGACTW